VNVASIRADLVEVCPSMYVKHAYVPETVKAFPAVIANPPRVVEYRATLGLCRLEIALTVVASSATIEDAQARLDAALSTDGPESVLAAIEGVLSTEWETALVMSIDNVRAVKDGAQTAMSVDIILEIFSKR